MMTKNISKIWAKDLFRKVSIMEEGLGRIFFCLGTALFCEEADYAFETQEMF